jgi:hypothetical protein
VLKEKISGREEVVKLTSPTFTNDEILRKTWTNQLTPNYALA